MKTKKPQLESKLNAITTYYNSVINKKKDRLLTILSLPPNELNAISYEVEFLQLDIQLLESFYTLHLDVIALCEERGRY